MKIKITLVEQKGTCPCHRGHKVGDTFDFDTERGKLCPMAAHVLFPMIDIFTLWWRVKEQCLLLPGCRYNKCVQN